MYTIKLADGTQLKKLELNGNNYISKTEIKDNVFEGNLETVEITDNETKEKMALQNCKLIQNKQYGDEWWFIIAEKSQEELYKEQVATNITDMELALAEVYEMLLGGI